MKNNTKFGIEIEFFTNYKTGIPASNIKNIISGSIYDICEHLKVSTSLPFVVGTRSQSQLSRWKLTTDSSVQENGLEIVSPILSGEEGMKQVQTVLDCLSKFAIVDNTCGLHVHVDATTLDTQQVALVAILGQSLYSFVPAKRYHDRYAKLFTIQEMIELKKFPKTLPPVQREKFVNIQAFGKHGTVEFRGLEGTLEFDVLSSWIEIVTSLVTYVKNKPRIGILDNKKVENMVKILTDLEFERSFKKIEILHLIANNTQYKKVLDECMGLATNSLKISDVAHWKEFYSSLDSFWTSIQLSKTQLETIMFFYNMSYAMTLTKNLENSKQEIFQEITRVASVAIQEIQTSIKLIHECQNSWNKKIYENINFSLENLNLTPETKEIYEMRTKIFG